MRGAWGPFGSKIENNTVINSDSCPSIMVKVGHGAASTFWFFRNYFLEGIMGASALMEGRLKNSWSRKVPHTREAPVQVGQNINCKHFVIEYVPIIAAKIWNIFLTHITGAGNLDYGYRVAHDFWRQVLKVELGNLKSYKKEINVFKMQR